MEKKYIVPVLMLAVLTFVLVSLAKAMPAFDGKGPEPRYTKSGALLNQPNPLTKGKKIAGSWKALIILIDFPDYLWDHQSDTNFVNDSLYFVPAHYDSMANSMGTFRYPECKSSYTGSIRDFYLENSYGQFDVVSTITGWYTADNNFSYYSANTGANAADLVEEAVIKADPYVDYSQYDNDGDGWVDALYVVHAGPGAEALPVSVRNNYIWSHASGISTQYRDGVYISTYSIEPEDGKAGVFCHEFGHVIGLPDLYDYTYLSSGVGEWCCMAGGSWCHRDSADARGTAPTHFSAWCKYQLGWIDPVNVKQNSLGTQIPPVENTPAAYRLWSNGDSTGTQYFLVENRQNIGFDSGFTRRQLSYGLPRGHGLLIWHVDESVYGNDNRAHKMVDLEEASPVDIGGFNLEHLDTVRTLPMDEFLYNGNRGDDGDPWPGYWTTSDYIYYDGSRDKNNFNQFTIPSSKNYANANTLVGVENIIETDTLITADLLVAINATVFYPASGDTVGQSENINVIWRSSAAGGISCDSLYFSSNNGGNWSLIGHSNSGDTDLAWTVPAVSSDQCLIKVVSLTNAGSKAANLGQKFTIGPAAGVSGGNQTGSASLKFRLLPAYPNPSSGGKITISFELPVSANACLTIFNIAGQTIKSLPMKNLSSGRHQVVWDGRDAEGNQVANGVYHYQLGSSAGKLTDRIVIVK
jgi:immune inhibitor A